MPPPTAQPAFPSGPGAWSVFLSSTIDDFDDYRARVTTVLQKFGTACDDCRTWSGAWEDVESMCRRHLMQANGYLLLLGHWYGSAQTPGRPSITQLEFECALERWKGTEPPYIAVMVPEQNSPADAELQLRAEAIVAKRQLDAADHAALMRSFRDRVMDWRKVNFFRDTEDLCNHALAISTNWRAGGFLAAARAQREAAPDAADDEPPRPDERALGMLGRGPQIDAVRQALAELKVGPYPALALLVHGDDKGGQRTFLAHLASAPLRGFRPSSSGGRLPHSCLDLVALCSWVAQTLGLKDAAEHSPTSVAERAAARLRERPMCLMLDGVGSFDGGAAGFNAQFWQPFFERLSALHAELPLPHRLVAVLSSYAGLSPEVEAITRAIDNEATDATASRLVALPALGPFTKAQVTRWLGEMNYADEPPGHLAEVARRAVTNDRGDVDLVPMQVLDRLRFELLKPLEDDS
ncbi:DUF4062 domain-containing protein [Variovorax sp. J22R115]|uniref:DUF4062 domain-containing protein n=1 Tax=Variovorax sp. J22R115 TaxID=3053509 RepID=UPI00257497A8|nr:DUF4062 domain-containing protein [Variovorax sp. J22R115]MDM0048613.1 DUF4062 domain-containing protein [Variovorax sp. J22R115]